MHDEWDDMPGAGRKILVRWAEHADVFVVATADGLRIVERADVDATAHSAIGGDALSSITWRGGDPLAGDIGGPLDHATITSLAYAVGVAEGALRLAVQHARDREQFGRPIGTFQAVAHRCADMRADIDACRYLAHQAAWAFERGDAELQISAAKSYANEAIRRVFLNAHQVHGAIGFSTEHPLHRFTTRLKAFELTYGGTSRHRQRLARAMGLRS
jgi:alkylation response protein AidB-like acyl-CoA dehydrogenase